MCKRRKAWGRGEGKQGEEELCYAKKGGVAVRGREGVLCQPVMLAVKLRVREEGGGLFAVGGLLAGGAAGGLERGGGGGEGWELLIIVIFHLLLL